MKLQALCETLDGNFNKQFETADRKLPVLSLG